MKGVFTVLEFISFLMKIEWLKTRTLNMNHHRCYGTAHYCSHTEIQHFPEDMGEEGSVRLAGRPGGSIRLNLHKKSIWHALPNMLISY